MLMKEHVITLLLLMVCSTSRPACGPADKIVTIKVTAEFFVRSLSKGASSQTAITGSQKFLSVYKEYYESLGNADAGRMNITGLPHDPFSPTVSADISKVFSAVSSYVPETPSDDPDSSDIFQETVTSQEEEYQPGFQMFRKLNYYLTVDGITATLVEELVYTIIPRETLLEFSQFFEFLVGLRDSYISRRYEDAGGEISGNTFRQTQCYTLIPARATRISDLEEKISALNETLITQYRELASLNDTLIAQYRELAPLNGILAIQDRELTSINDTVTSLVNKQTRVISAPEGLGSVSCIVTCAGSTEPGTTAWVGSTGYLYTTVSMSECGFNSIPIITAAVQGNSYNRWMLESMYSATSSHFKVWMEGWVYSTRLTGGASSSRPNTAQAASEKWHVMWHATGYVC